MHPMDMVTWTIRTSLPDLNEMIPLGRTARTFRNALDIEEERWKPFKRTLKPMQRDNLDRVFDYARSCADAGTMLATPRITEVVLVSTIIEMLQELQDPREKVAQFEEKKWHL